jgi:NAD+ diphosphatase
LAGFVEAGESVEACAVREVQEEARIDVDVQSICLAATQPWPLSRVEAASDGTSLMVAVFARSLTNAAPRPNAAELAEARWFPIEVVKRALAGERDALLQLPGREAIARHMIEAFVEAHGGRAGL